MADPSPYVVGFSFSDFQSNNPATPLPTQQVDNELADVASAVATLVAAIKDVRRSDGALKNGIVTFDSLALGLQLTFDPTNGALVANAVAGAQASATAAGNSATAASSSATNAATSASAAAASASSVNLSLFLAKANNLAGLGSLVTSRANLGLGTAAVLDVGTTALKIVQLDGSGLLPALDGSQLINIDTLPVGSTIWVNALSPPAGFVKENGALLSRASFPRLWTFANASGNLVSEATWAAGNSGGFSTGDLSTTFRVPDARGEFIRGYDDGRGADAGRALATHQGDGLKDHSHNYLAAIDSASRVSGTGNLVLPTISGTSTATNGPSTGGLSETRPRNNVKLACIKY